MSGLVKDHGMGGRESYSFLPQTIFRSQTDRISQRGVVIAQLGGYMSTEYFPMEQIMQYYSFWVLEWCRRKGSSLGIVIPVCTFCLQKTNHIFCPISVHYANQIFGKYTFAATKVAKYSCSFSPTKWGLHIIEMAVSSIWGQCRRDITFEKDLQVRRVFLLFSVFWSFTPPPPPPPPCVYRMYRLEKCSGLKCYSCN